MRLTGGLILSCALGSFAADGDISTSQNYAITIATFPGGGGRSASENYTNDLVITPVTGRSVAQLQLGSLAITYGFSAQINNPPDLGDDVRSHTPGVAVTILNSSLLANDSDPEADPISITSVSPLSEAGGSVSLTRGTVRYVPPEGLAGVDRFQYSATDSNGDFSVATVTMVIGPAGGSQDIGEIAIVRQTDGRVLVRFLGNPNEQLYKIEFAPNLTERNWQVIYTADPGEDGIVEFLLDPSVSREGYYRASTL